MRILHLIGSRGFYGAESMLLALAAAQRDMGCAQQVAVIVKTGNTPSTLASLARVGGLDAVEFSSGSRADWGLAWRLRRHIQTGRFDVVHTHGYKADVLGYLAARSAGVPLLATAHSWTEGGGMLRLYARLDRWLLLRFPLVAAVSESVAAQLGGARANVRSVPNGVDVERFRSPGKFPASSGVEAVVGMSGRLVPDKGFQFLLRAAQAILLVKPKTTFVIYGDGPYQAELETLAAALGIAARVQFAGHQADMAAVLKSLDVFVLPSLREGMPMALLEAMAAGVAVVATPVGGVRRAVIHGKTGLLVAPRSEKELADAVLRLLSEPEFAKRLAAAGQQHVAGQFSSARMAAQYVALYRELGA